MFKRLRERALEPEKMDDFTAGGPELLEAHRHLRRLNRLFGAARPTLYGVQRLWAAAGNPSRFSLLDIGAGSGDVNRRLLRWADRYGIGLTITLGDITEEACQEARRYFRDEPRVQVRRMNLFELEAGQADIVTGTQLLHHFAGEELAKAAASMLNASRWGVVLNDIHRHWLPWTAVWLTTRLVSANPYIRHDGPLSVAKGFTAADWSRLKQTIGASGEAFASEWVPLFRYAVTIQKNDPKIRA